MPRRKSVKKVVSSLKPNGWDSKGASAPLAESRGRASGRVRDSVPHIATKRPARGEFKNSPVDCF